MNVEVKRGKRMIPVYTYEVLDEETGNWEYSNLNWTTGDALAKVLSDIGDMKGKRVISRYISADELVANPTMPFVSDYVRESIGLSKGYWHYKKHQGNTEQALSDYRKRMTADDAYIVVSDYISRDALFDLIDSRLMRGVWLVMYENHDDWYDESNDDWLVEDDTTGAERIKKNIRNWIEEYTYPVITIMPASLPEDFVIANEEKGTDNDR